jgi:hypothetical protein
MPSPCRAAPLKSASAAGWRRWRLEPIGSLTTRAETPSPLSRLKAAILRQRQLRWRSGRPTRAALLTRSVKLPMRAGTRTAACGPCQSLARSAPAAMAGDRGSRGVKSSRAPRKRRHSRRGRGSAGGSDIRFPAMPACPPFERAIGTHGELADPGTIRAF